MSSYFTTEQCPTCGRHTDGLRDRFACTVCDTVWASGIPESVVGPSGVLEHGRHPGHLLPRRTQARHLPK
ncbi:hypothetical protein ACFVTY_10895 [Streptomyces sp. NPDC058067]|uniref:hypothetical protein n=1 Tax=Streptomyces sp. NPDC058067 TaxID=3346324 RepID=UPI0036E864B5